MVERAHKPASVSIIPKTTKSLAVVDLSPARNLVHATLPSGDSIDVSLFGATIVSWRTKDLEALWFSEAAKLDGTAPIRGGIPIVFPVFGKPPKGHATEALPQHGFARTARWEFLGSNTSEHILQSCNTSSVNVKPSEEISHLNKHDGDDDNTTTVTDVGDATHDSIKLDFGLFSDALKDDVRRAWPFRFGLVYTITLSHSSLRTSLTVQNTGNEVFEFNALFHNYLCINDIYTTSVSGLGSVTYMDKLLTTNISNPYKAEQTTHELSVVGPIDRVYSLNDSHVTSSSPRLISVNFVNHEQDGVNERKRFDIHRYNLPDVVLWNPWREGAAAIADLMPKGDAPTGYRSFLCVEPGHVHSWVSLEPGESWEGSQIIKYVQ